MTRPGCGAGRRARARALALLPAPLRRKPLMPIDGDKRFSLDEVLFNVARHGFDDIVLLAGHLHEQFETNPLCRPDWCGTREFASSSKRRRRGLAGRSSMPRPSSQRPFFSQTATRCSTSICDGSYAVLANEPGALAALPALRRVPDVAALWQRRSPEQRNPSVSREERRATGPGRADQRRRWPAPPRDTSFHRSHTPASIESDIYPRLAEAGAAQRRRVLGLSSPSISVCLDTLAQARARKFRGDGGGGGVLRPRTGVLNHDAGYTHRVEDLKWISGAIETVRCVNDAGALAIVITNQAGIARGYYTTADADRFHAAMAADLARAGAHIDAFYVCPYHPQGNVEAYRASRPSRPQA